MLHFDTAKENFNYGHKLYTLDQYDQAIPYFARAIELDPLAVAPYYYRGSAYQYLGRFKEAITDLSQVIQLGSDHGRVYQKRAYCYGMLGQNEKALLDSCEDIRLSNSDRSKAVSYYLRGQIYHRQEKFALALADYSEAIKLSPNHAVYYSRAVSYLKQDKLAEALLDFSVARKYDPTAKSCYSEWREISDYLLKRSFLEWVLFAQQFFVNMRALPKEEELKVLNNVDYEPSPIAKAFKELKCYDVVREIMEQALSRRDDLRRESMVDVKTADTKIVGKAVRFESVADALGALFSQRKWDANDRFTITLQKAEEQESSITFTITKN